jgi:hypothetical protein
VDLQTCRFVELCVRLVPRRLFLVINVPSLQERFVFIKVPDSVPLRLAYSVFIIRRPVSAALIKTGPL